MGQPERAERFVKLPGQSTCRTLHVEAQTMVTHVKRGSVRKVGHP